MIQVIQMVLIIKKNADEEAQQEAEAQKDDSSDDIWGSIKTGLEIGAMFI